MAPKKAVNPAANPAASNKTRQAQPKPAAKQTGAPKTATTTAKNAVDAAKYAVNASQRKASNLTATPAHPIKHSQTSNKPKQSGVSSLTAQKKQTGGQCQAMRPKPVSPANIPAASKQAQPKPSTSQSPTNHFARQRVSDALNSVAKEIQLPQAKITSCHKLTGMMELLMKQVLGEAWKTKHCRITLDGSIGSDTAIYDSDADFTIRTPGEPVTSAQRKAFFDLLIRCQRGQFEIKGKGIKARFLTESGPLDCDIVFENSTFDKVVTERCYPDLPSEVKKVARLLKLAKANNAAGFRNTKGFMIVYSTLSCYQDLKHELKREPSVIELFQRVLGAFSVQGNNTNEDLDRFNTRLERVMQREGARGTAMPYVQHGGWNKGDLLAAHGTARRFEKHINKLIDAAGKGVPQEELKRGVSAMLVS